MLGAVLALLSCEGGGSDIGPTIPEIPNEDYRVLVLDDAGRFVTNAAVRIDNLAEIGVTNQLGRSRISGSPSGIRLVSIDGRSASATDTDRLGSLVVSATLPDGGELPYAVYLPDISGSTGVTLNTGVLGTTVTLDDSATSGVILTVPAGTDVGAGGASSVTIRSGGLQNGHLPGVLPVPPANVRLWGAGAYIDPTVVTFAPGAALSMPNDLGLAAGALADLFHLELASGNWTQIGSGVVDGSGARIDAPAGSINTGGLYVFATVVPTSTTLTGRIVDPNGRLIPGALVRASGATTRSLGDGSFTLPPIAAVDASGAPLTVNLEANGGRSWRPTGIVASVPLTPGMQSVGDQEMETSTVGIVRIQMITEGFPDTNRRMNWSSSLGSTLGLGVGDSNGFVSYEDQFADSFSGLLTSRPKDLGNVYTTEVVANIGGQHHIDLQIFARTDFWWAPRSGNGPTATLVRDAIGTGPVQQAAVIAGDAPGTGLVGFTPENGAISVTYGNVNQGTASKSTTADGRTVISAWTSVDIDSARIEVPLEIARQVPNGGFTPHGLVFGQLVGGGVGTKTRSVFSTRQLTIEDWYDQIYSGFDLAGKFPRKFDPAVTGGTAFEIGVATERGNLSAAEGVMSGGVFTLERMGLVPRLAPQRGGTIQQDIPLDLVADTVFLGQDSLTNLAPPMTIADLSFDLLTQLADGNLVESARAVNGNMTQNGTSIEFTLPALQGQLGGGTYFVTLSGSNTSAGKTVSQRTIIPFREPIGPFVRFLDVPDIVSPAPGATVPATGFTVTYTVPISTLYILVKLRSETPTEVNDWTAILPASFNSFTFRELPMEAANPLVAGRTWTLSVTAARVETGVLSVVGDAYRRTIQNWIGIGPGDQQINATSSTSIQITTN